MYTVYTSFPSDLPQTGIHCIYRLCTGYTGWYRVQIPVYIPGILLILIMVQDPHEIYACLVHNFEAKVVYLNNVFFYEPVDDELARSLQCLTC